MALRKAQLSRHWLVYGALAAACLLLFVHPDVVETANHSYLLLQSLFSGRAGSFYLDVAAHQNDLYYINHAHYNIIVYLIFALAELPVYLVGLLAGGVSEPALYFTGKLVSAGFFAGCIVVTGKIAAELGLDVQDSRRARLCLALWPPAFFSVFVMGQYDSLPLLFLLLGFLYWLRGGLWRCTFWVGLGAACKFFPLLVFLPLLLLREKRPLHILKYAACSLWLLAPTTLLYLGRTGNMAAFNDEMLGRLFASGVQAANFLPLFPFVYLLLCLSAWLWRPADKKQAGLWLGLASLAVFFLLVEWHPQWVVLPAPFVVLSTLTQKRRAPWYIVDLLLCGGFVLLCAVKNPLQLEANLLDFGLVGLATGLVTTGAHNPVWFYWNLVPLVLRLPFALFAAGLVAHTIGKLPLPGGVPAARLGRGAAAFRAERRPLAMAWALFFATGLLWLAPTLFTWLKATGIL